MAEIENKINSSAKHDEKKRFKRRHFAPKRKVCRLCQEHIEKVDYKQIQILKTFMSNTGKILSRRITGNCARHQRQIARAIKINRNISLLPYSN